MALNLTISDVSVVGSNALQVTVNTSVRGSTVSQGYEGEINVTGAPQTDRADIQGRPGRGAGVEHVVTLDPGLSSEDLPAEVLVTVVLDTGVQEQMFVTIEPDEPTDNNQPDMNTGDGFPVEEVALAVGALAAGYVAYQQL